MTGIPEYSSPIYLEQLIVTGLLLQLAAVLNRLLELGGLLGGHLGGV